ncbi:MAG: PEP-CTERM sorting domain-containing protein, partial [Planctomycetes bacterium]|nr:PEP-CTERM sorting domain-containing protein [Planctomycetota bacterium]
MRRNVPVLVVCVVLRSISVDAHADEVFFELLGDLPGGFYFSEVHAVSADGTTAAGFSSSDWADLWEVEAFRWTRDGGIVGLGGLAGPHHGSESRGVSADGSVVVGGSYNGYLGYEAFRWEDGVMVGLGDLPGGSHSSIAYDVSADGSVIVGRGRSASGNHAFR